MPTVWEAAEAAMQTLHNLGYHGASFVGGVACALHGNNRTPKDLDILIVGTSDEQEAIKRRIVACNSSFYLVPSRKIGATYKVLWYDTNHYGYNGYLGRSRESSTSIKVDILLPGVMDIPSFDTRHIARITPPSRSISLPTAPLSLVLLLKLQAWSQHRAAVEYYYSKEQYKDKLDLECLVPIAATKRIKPKTDAFLPSQFVSKAELRIKEYLGIYPESSTRNDWAAMGFTVPSKPAVTSAGISISRSTSYSSIGTSLGGMMEGASTATRIHRVKPLPRVRPLYSYGSTRY